VVSFEDISVLQEKKHLCMSVGYVSQEKRLVRLTYQPPGSSTFLSEQISHQQPASSTFLSQQTSTSCSGVSENPDKILEHVIENSKHVQVMTREEIKNLLQTAQVSKVVNLFTRALTPPFIGRRRDFYIPTIPLNSKNIPSVNTHKCLLHLIHLQACH
jgi:neutral trehalase